MGYEEDDSEGISKKWFISIIVISLIIISYLTYDHFQKSEIILKQSAEISEKADLLATANSNIEFLNTTLKERDNKISELSSTVSQKESEIIKSTEKISELEQIKASKERQIQDLKEAQAALKEEGKIIVDMYKNTLILYDDPKIYSAQYKYMEYIKNDGMDYSKLGIPFIYFRDESKKTEDGIILGTYSSLYDYIYIYKDNNDSRTIYHEIGHIIYKNLFIEVKSNLEIWKDFYNQLKEANLLSTQYSYTNEIEGFSEEYSVYKTGFKQQPQEVVNFFKDVEDKIN
ncbi:MAG TPA: hypothetical protein VJB94_04980 [Candidatus Nanoarchaeia archaeon]|nr:hypothetical protein [Candidatus Nanoarchaeia archaeon]